VIRSKTRAHLDRGDLPTRAKPDARQLLIATAEGAADFARLQPPCRIHLPRCCRR
jgi:hypothetical protein